MALDNVPQECSCKCFRKSGISLLDYGIIINVELSFAERYPILKTYRSIEMSNLDNPIIDIFENRFPPLCKGGGGGGGGGGGVPTMTIMSKCMET